jgi:hypothetical protein
MPARAFWIAYRCGVAKAWISHTPMLSVVPELVGHEELPVCVSTSVDKSGNCRPLKALSPAQSNTKVSLLNV